VCRVRAASNEPRWSENTREERSPEPEERSQERSDRQWSGEITREERSPLARGEIDARHAPLREVRTQGLGIGIWELGF
jgi:hypothetical protein